MFSFLVAVPVILLGACSPYALRLAVPDVEHSGRVAGRLYAISTAGSLLGTMLAALVLIPFAGTQRTFLAFAAALALVAALGMGWRFLAVPGALIGAFALPVGTIKAAGDGRVLYEGESALQYIRVVEEPDGVRVLELNEGQARHSVYRPGSYLTGGLLGRDAGVAVQRPSSGPPQRVAILGNGAGTTARAYGHFFPGAHLDGVEIDPELEEVGRRYFDMGSNPNLTVLNEDARPWLRRSEGGYDVIIVDSYRQPYVPFYLATREFFDLVRDRLAPEGVVVVNVGHPEGNDDLEKVIGRTMSAVFPSVLARPVRRLQHAARRQRGGASADVCADADPHFCRRAFDGWPRAEAAKARATPSRRERLHRRPGAGGVAGRSLHPRLRSGA